MASSISTTGNGYNFKVVLLGEGCVGKTSVALRYVEDKFNDKHVTTVQVSDITVAFLYNMIFLSYYLCNNCCFLYVQYKIYIIILRKFIMICLNKLFNNILYIKISRYTYYTL